MPCNSWFPSIPWGPKGESGKYSVLKPLAHLPRQKLSFIHQVSLGPCCMPSSREQPDDNLCTYGLCMLVSRDPPSTEHVLYNMLICAKCMLKNETRRTLVGELWGFPSVVRKASLIGNIWESWGRWRDLCEWQDLCPIWKIVSLGSHLLE